MTNHYPKALQISRQLLLFSFITALFIFPEHSKAYIYANISQPFNDTLLCKGTSLNIYYNTDTTAAGNIFTIQLSDMTGSFASPTVIGTLNTQSATGSIQCNIPGTQPAGAAYRIRIIQSVPYNVSADNGKNIRISDFPTIGSITSNSPVCEGITVAINATASPSTVTYSWAGPQSYTSTSQNPTVVNPDTNAKGKYYLTVSNYGCKRTDSTYITVIQQPTKPVIITNSPACEGGILSLTAQSNNGVQYQWKMPGGNTVNYQTIGLYNVQLTSGGKYVVKAFATGCSSSDSITVLIKPRPDSAIASNSGPVCEGDTLKLFAQTNNTNVSFLWSGPNGFSTTTKNPILPNVTFAADGVYKVNTVLNGCLSLDATTVASIGIPLTAPNVTANGPLCPGDSLRLIAQASVNIGQYKWIGPNNFSYIGKSPTINPVSHANEGTYSVTLSYNGCTSAPGSVFIKIPDVPKPVPHTNSPLCIGDTLRLMCDDIPGGTFKWMGPNNFISLSKDTIIADVGLKISGNYLIYNSVDGCNSYTNVPVVVNPDPVVTSITSNTPVCEGTALKLSASGDLDSCKFVWRGPNGFDTTGKNPEKIIGLSGAGKYYVKAIALGCPSAEDSTEVEVLRKPDLPNATSNSPLKEGQELRLLASSPSDSVTYEWTGPDSFKSQEQNPVIKDITTEQTGSYIVTAKTPFGCVSSSVTIVLVHANPNGVFVIFPNPTTSTFTLKGRTTSDNPVPLEIVAMNGAVVFKTEVTPTKKVLNQQIDIPQSLSSGMYMLRLMADGKMTNIRFTLTK